MKKLMISTSVLVGVAVLGGGYLLWPNGSQSATPVATTTTSSAVTKKVTSPAAKAASTKTSSQQSSSDSSKSTPSSQTTPTGTSQSSSAKTQSTTTATSTSTTGTVATDNLSADQINDWVWQQLAAEYQGTKTTKADFGFNQTKKADGLVYIEVRETVNDQVSHLAGIFRVNANGQLEKQDTAKGADAWDVVAQAYK